MTCERVTGITRRYIWRDSSLPVTQRYTIAAPEMPAVAPLSVTQHYVWQAPENERSRVGQFNKGVLLADRYRILSGPLGESSGEGEVYCCQDEERAQKVAVKLYHGQNAPKQSVIEQLQGLVHPYIVRLQDYGQWQGQFYEVMDYCTGGVLSDVMPLTEDELEALIPGVVQALRFCHEQGIIHRDLKPNNLFFNNLDDGILLGDFGISSYLEKSAAQVTQTFHHLTLDYAAPELLDGHVVSDKTDYYALGLTLVHILLGVSPFSGQSNNEILVAHLRGRIPLPKTLSSRWRSLIRGLTHLQPEVRWGYRQVMAWLQEEPIPLAASLHPATTSRSTPSGMPSRSKADTSNTDHHSHAYPDTTSARYPGFPEASTPAQLARNLDRFEAMERLIKGDIRRWLFDFISPVMAGAVDDLAACVSPDELSGTSGLEAQILMRLRYILDPDTSLIVEGETIDNLTQLANLAKHADRSKISSLDATLWSGEIEAWIAAKERAGNRTNELLSRISAIRQRLSQTGHPRVALFALRFTLDPQQPLHLFSRYSIAHPHDLGALFSRPSSALHGVVKKLIFGRYFEEWIRAAEFPGWETDIRFIEDARLRYLDSKDVGVYSVIWHYSPDVPLPFQGHAITKPRDLARLIDKDDVSQKKGMALMKLGWLRAWLIHSSKVNNTAALDFVLLDTTTSDEAKLENMLQLLDPFIARPQLCVQPKVLHFGSVDPGAPRKREVILSNEGRGHLYGHVFLKAPTTALVVHQARFEGSQSRIEITVNSIGLEPGRYRNQLVIESNGGTLQIDVAFYVKAESSDESWWGRITS